MSEKTLLVLPNNGETLARLIEAIPADWSWVDGKLEPPDALIESGQVAKTAGYFIGRFHSINPTIIGPWNPKTQMKDRPDLCEILIERKLPLFVLFNEAGFQERTVTLEVAKKIAAHHVRLGYRGWLDFSSGCYDDGKYENPATCRLNFSRQEFSVYRTNWQLEVGWSARYGGKPELIEPILEACRTLGLATVETTSAA